MYLNSLLLSCILYLKNLTSQIYVPKQIILDHRRLIFSNKNYKKKKKIILYYFIMTYFYIN